MKEVYIISIDNTTLNGIGSSEIIGVMPDLDKAKNFIFRMARLERLDETIKYSDISKNYYAGNPDRRYVATPAKVFNSFEELAKDH